MADPTLSDLLAPQTSDDALATLLQRLTGKAFPVTSWQSGGIARTLLALFADAVADSGELLVDIASGGFVGLASGDWLTLLASEVYGLARNPALFTSGTCVLTAAASSSGYTIVAGQLVAISTSGLRYTNTAGGQLAAGGTLSLTFQAEQPGSSYNVSPDSITVLGTPLPGVTIDNPEIGTTGTWVTSSGTDEETDDSLRARCQARWPSLSTTPTDDVLALWAKAASPQVTRALSRADGTTPGQADLYVGGDDGALTSDVVTTVQDYVSARMPLTSTCVVASVTAVTITVEATLFVKAGYETTAQAAAQAAAEAYVRGVDIDGTDYQSDVVAALQGPTGVRNVNLTVLSSTGAGVGDVDLSAIAGGPNIGTPSVTLTVTTV